MSVGTLDTQGGLAREAALPRWLQLLSQAWCELLGLPPGDAPAAQADAPARYRHPHTGQAWDGHGHQPQWLRDALLREGHTVEALRRAARRAA